jgi:thiosulfate reductase cytochrome b subunit
MSHRLYLYPVWIRLWHFLNALAFIVLIFTGLSMHFSGIEYNFLSFRLATILHNISGIVLVALYLVFIAGTFFTSNRRHYEVEPKSWFGNLIRQAQFYLVGIMKGESHPFPTTEKRKFNPLQQLAYIAVMFLLMPAVIVTGLFLLFPLLAPDKIMGAGGIWPMAVVHSVAGYLASVFLVVHVYLGTTGETPTALYKNMLTGWHESSQGDETTSAHKGRPQY